MKHGQHCIDSLTERPACGVPDGHAAWVASPDLTYGEAAYLGIALPGVDFPATVDPSRGYEGEDSFDPS